MIYRLPDILGGAELEATEWWSGCAGANHEYRIQGTSVTVSVPYGLTAVDPPLPPEPPVGTVVLDRDGRVWVSLDLDRWQSVVGGREFWVDLVAARGPLTLLVPDPFGEPVELPWWSDDRSRIEVHPGAARSVTVWFWGKADTFRPASAREMAKALWAAADAAEATT